MFPVAFLISVYLVTMYSFFQCVDTVSDCSVLCCGPSLPWTNSRKKQVGPNETKKSEYCDVSGVYYMTHFIMLMQCSRLITPVIFYVYLMYNIDFLFIVFDL